MLCFVLPSTLRLSPFGAHPFSSPSLGLPWGLGEGTQAYLGKLCLLGSRYATPGKRISLCTNAGAVLVIAAREPACRGRGQKPVAEGGGSGAARLDAVWPSCPWACLLRLSFITVFCLQPRTQLLRGRSDRCPSSKTSLCSSCLAPSLTGNQGSSLIENEQFSLWKYSPDCVSVLPREGRNTENFA